MSLDYDLRNMENREERFPAEENGDLNAKVQSLIWLTIPVGMEEITNANIKDFWIRADLWQKTMGAQFSRAVVGEPAHFPPGTSDGDRTRWEPIYVTREDVENAVGLHTNASRKTKTQFLRDLYEAHDRFKS